MVIGKVGFEIAKGILNAEKGILGKAWWGFKKKKEIVAGIRTGLAGGAGIGTFINDSPFDSGDGTVPFQSKANKFVQSRFRRNRTRSSRRNYKYNKHCNCRGRLHRNCR